MGGLAVVPPSGDRATRGGRATKLLPLWEARSLLVWERSVHAPRLGRATRGVGSFSGPRGPAGSAATSRGWRPLQPRLGPSAGPPAWGSVRQLHRILCGLRLPPSLFPGIAGPVRLPWDARYLWRVGGAPDCASRSKAAHCGCDAAALECTGVGEGSRQRLPSIAAERPSSRCHAERGKERKKGR
jgi:hypothetical protein